MKNLAEVAENFPSKITRFRDPNMAVHDIILDCDWFVLGAERLVKQIAFFDTRSGMSLLYVFHFPKRYRRLARYFDHQSRSSHLIPWDKPGMFRLGDVCCALQTIKFVTGAQNVVFWAKGLEKVRILSNHGIDVINLELVGCPRFDQLSTLHPTTMNKAKAFAAWFVLQDSSDEDFCTPPSSPSHDSS